MLDRVGVKDFDSIGWSKAVASAALDLIPSRGRRLLFLHPALAEENNCLDGYDYHVHDGQVHLSMEKFTIFKSFRDWPWWNICIRHYSDTNPASATSAPLTNS